MTAIDAGEAVRFLKLLFEGAEDGHIGIWVKEPGEKPKLKDSYWFAAADPEAAFQTIDKQAPVNDVYVHLALQREPTPSNLRGTSAGASAMPGLCLDLDWADPGAHKKGNIPPDIEACLGLVALFPLKPTIVIHSGHGLQVYWLYRELWTLEGAEDREIAELRGERLTRWFRGEAGKHGWDVDSAHDLAHVFRLPGTLNHKYDPKPVVTVYEANYDARYNPSDLDAILPVHDRAEALNAVEVGPVLIDVKASPDVDKLMAAIDNIDKFRGSWERTRKDIQDRSNSGWDMSLASLVVPAGWSDQEIVDLWIASRRKHGQPPPDGRSYIEHTLRKARTATDQAQAMAELSSGAPAEHDDTLELLSRALAAPVTAAIRRGRVDATYFLVVDGQQASIGTAKAIQNQAGVRAALYDVTKKMFPPVKTPQWFKVCEAIAAIAVLEEQPDGEPQATIEAWCSDYVRGKTAGVDERPWQEALSTAEPFYKDGKWWVSVGALSTHLAISHSRRVDDKAIRDLLGRAGSRPRTFAANGTSRSYWTAPLNGSRNGNEKHS